MFSAGQKRDESTPRRPDRTVRVLPGRIVALDQVRGMRSACLRWSPEGGRHIITEVERRATDLLTDFTRTHQDPAALRRVVMIIANEIDGCAAAGRIRCVSESSHRAARGYHWRRTCFSFGTQPASYSVPQ